MPKTRRTLKPIIPAVVRIRAAIGDGLRASCCRWRRSSTSDLSRESGGSIVRSPVHGLVFIT